LLHYGRTGIGKIEEEFARRHQKQVEIIGSACLGCHENEGVAKPPYAKVGDVLLEECTEDKLLDEIYRQLGIERE
jgi:hypothetical protein